MISETAHKKSNTQRKKLRDTLSFKYNSDVPFKGSYPQQLHGNSKDVDEGATKGYRVLQMSFKYVVIDY